MLRRGIAIPCKREWMARLGNVRGENLASEISARGASGCRCLGLPQHRRAVEVERGKVRAARRVRQHGDRDQLFRDGAPDARLRGVSARGLEAAAGRASCAHDAERAAISDRAIWRVAGRLHGGELQSALHAQGTQASTRRFRCRRPSSSWKTSRGWWNR